MPYRKSKSLYQLETSYAEIGKRLRSVSTPATPVTISEYVKSAAIFIAHAELENYFADLFDTYANCIQKSVNNCAGLHVSLRAHLFLTRTNTIQLVATFLSNRDERVLNQKFGAASLNSAGTYVDGSRSLHQFGGSHIVLDQKYPSLKNIASVFSRIGVDNVFDKLNAKVGGDCRSLLSSLGELRTQLAHTGSIPGVSEKDIRTRIADVIRVTRAMDRIVYSEVCSFGSDNIWKTNA